MNSSYTFKPGETINMDVQILDDLNNAVNISGATNIRARLYIKNVKVAQFQLSGTTSINGYNVLTIKDSSTITLPLSRTITKNFVVGEISASVLVDVTNTINEYSYIMGSVLSGKMFDEEI